MCARVACVCVCARTVPNRQPQRSASPYTHASYRQAVGRLQSVIMNLVLDSCAAAAQPSPGQRVYNSSSGKYYRSNWMNSPSKRNEQSYNNTRNISSLCPESLLDALYVHNLSPDYIWLSEKRKSAVARAEELYCKETCASGNKEPTSFSYSDSLVWCASEK